MLGQRGFIFAFLVLVMGITTGSASAQAQESIPGIAAMQFSSYDAWTGDVTIAPVLPTAPRHSLHSYFNVSPESPDQQWVLLFTSEREDAQIGDVVIVHRTSGEVRTLAKDVEVEDGHRQANQQWISNGKSVVHMELVGDQWQVVRTDIEDLKRVVLCTGRQLGWGQPHLDVVPLYGPHWNPGEYRDLELLNVQTGEIRTVLTAEQVTQTHRELINKRLGADRPISIFFPQISPDGRRVFFKLATPSKGVFRSGADSDRECLLVYDLETAKPLVVQARWGHPAWHADSRRIVNQRLIIDIETRQSTEIPNLPGISGSHGSMNADGSVYVTDIFNEKYVQPERRWAVLLADPADASRHHVLHIAPASGSGTRSWRQAHPHPAFNAAGNRLYFNVIENGRTVLHAAEIVPAK